MARRRFFVPQVRRGTAELTGEDAEHLVRVLRAEVGQVYEISDNQRLYLAEITAARKSLVEFTVREELPVPHSPVEVLLLPALIKFDRFEWLLEKATELGVSEVKPVIATRSEHGLEKAAAKRSARWERIGVEASQQSRRSRLPIISEAVKFSSALSVQADVRLFLDEDPSASPLLDQLPSDRKQGMRVALLLGPEGGWTEEERAEAINAGWQACSLCGSVLRAETAAVAGLAITQAAWLQSRSEPAGHRPEAS